MEAGLLGLEILNSWAQDTGGQLKFLLLPGEEPAAGAGPPGREPWGPGTAQHGGASREGGAGSSSIEGHAGPAGSRRHSPAEPASRNTGTPPPPPCPRLGCPPQRGSQADPAGQVARLVQHLVPSPRPSEWPGTGADHRSWAEPEVRCLLLSLTCSAPGHSHPDTPAALATRGQAGQGPSPGVGVTTRATGAHPLPTSLEMGSAGPLWLALWGLGTDALGAQGRVQLPARGLPLLQGPTVKEAPGHPGYVAPQGP